MASPAEILAQYEHLVANGANEAETRLKVINDVLYSVLGWTHADVKPEERVSEDRKTTWADYTLRTAMTAIVIEAKKVGVAFTEVPGARRVQLSGKWLEGETGDAITQARDYARKLGIPFAVVTNGNSWIVFPATRVDQVRFQDSSAIVFQSLKSALEDDYAEFHDLLSRDAVISGSLDAELLGRIENQIEDRRLNRYFTTSFSRISRHSLFPLIEDAITVAFSEDIVNGDADLLEKCYVRTPERIRFDQRIKMHIARKDAVTLRAPARPMRDAKYSILDIVKTSAEKAKPVAVLVLGQVGAGKSTFLQFTRQVGAKEEFRPNAAKAYPHWLYVDFRAYASGESALNFLVEALKAHINQDQFLSSYDRCISHAYKSEIEALFKGPLYLLADDEAERKRRISQLLMIDYEKSQPYVEKILRYAATSAPIFLVIDNVDQFEEDSLQSQVFNASMAMAQKLKINLVCSMREATYIQHKNTAVFDAFEFDPVAIDPPNIITVLSKRFFVARQLLEGQSANFVAENGATMNVSSLSVVIDLIQGSVLGTELGNLIEVLATSDIRLALRMTREFLRSGWTASGKALRIFQSTGKYIMPQHEALRAIMLGNQQVYSEEFSELGNPFDSRLAKTEAQLLRLFVLSAVVNLSAERSFRHIEGTEIQKHLREIGFGDPLIARVLSDLCRLRFMHTTSHGAPTFESNYIASRLGGHIVRNFIGNFTYIENVMMDTFISDERVWNELRSQTSAIYAQRDTMKKLRIRKDRAVTFFNFMRDEYDQLHEESIRRGLPKEWCAHPLKAIQHDFENNLKRALASGERNYGPGANTTPDIVRI